MNPHHKSEIRDSVIEALENRVRQGSYKRYLKRITLTRVRGFTDKEIAFDFPVTALVGPNGGGKTTILGAAAVIHKNVMPTRFFARSGTYDSMSGWAINYELLDPANGRNFTYRSVTYTSKWNRTPIDRQVILLGVARTVPAVERKELHVTIGSSFAAVREVALTEAVTTSAARILDKTITGFDHLYIDDEGRLTMLAGRTEAGERYSEFHFGSGEASVIRIVAEIEAAEDESLILIDEIENGLHPSATERLVEYLIDAARRKSCQVIFTTHSNDAIRSLPRSAIWAAYGGEVFQGKLDIAALRTITGRVEAALAIFVEDEFAALMVAMALRHSDLEVGACRIHGMGGSAPALKLNDQHNLDPTRRFPSICVLDGDQAKLADSARSVFVLPGAHAPERYVFARVLDRLDSVAAKLTVAIQLPSAQQERVKGVVRQVARTNRDFHVIWQQIGDQLDFTSSLVVQNAFLTVWAQEYPEDVRALVDPFRHLVPARVSSPDSMSLIPNQGQGVTVD